MRRGFPAGPIVAGLLVLLSVSPAFAQCGAGGCASCDGGASSCGRGCKGDCPPKWHYTYEGPPKIKWHKGCPRPICDPCYLEHYGYYQTCWAPWPYPPDWSHCNTPPPGAVLPPPAYPPYSPRIPRTAPSTVAPQRDPRTPENPLVPETKKAPLPELDPPRPLDGKGTVLLIQ